MKRVIVDDDMVERACRSAGVTSEFSGRFYRQVLEAALNPSEEPGWLTRAQLKAGCEALLVDADQMINTNKVVDVVFAVLRAGPIKPLGTMKEEIPVTDEMLGAGYSAYNSLRGSPDQWDCLRLAYRAMVRTRMEEEQAFANSRLAARNKSSSAHIRKGEAVPTWHTRTHITFTDPNIRSPDFFHFRKNDLDKIRSTLHRRESDIK